MAFITADRVLDSSTSTGTGAFVVSGTPAAGYRTFSAVMSVSDTCYYSIQGQTTAEFEVGLGTYSSANTLTRTTVYSSSNANAAVSFSAGTKNVFITMAASRAPQLDPSGNVTALGTPTSVNLTNATNLPLASGVSGTLPTANGGLGASLSPTTAGNVLFTADGSVWSSTQKIVQASVQTPSAVASVSFTSIPSWVKRITILMNGLSTSGTSDLSVRIGSGSFVSTGYVGSTAYVSQSSVAAGGAGATTAFTVGGYSVNTCTISGVVTLYNITGNIWNYVSTVTRNGGTTAQNGVQTSVYVPLSLSGVLDRVQLLAVNTTDTFDAGSVNILYE
jgi:hypothetical protein